MISICGTVWGRRQGSFLYAVFSGEHVYFGETGDVPPARWGQHLAGAESSFAAKLRRVDDQQSESDAVVFFVGLYCDAVDTIEKNKRKIARRAIEEELHRQFLLNKNLLPAPKILLSTPPPPVVRHRFPFDVEQMAAQAYKSIVAEYIAWLRKVE
jgi:hypothetical protein